MGIKCIGCGIELQNKNSRKEGYTPKEIVNTSEGLYCQRCFKVKNYGEYIPVHMNREDYKKEVLSVLDKAKVAIPVFDIIDFEGSFDEEILDILRELDSIVVINKLDLIPSDVHPSKVADWIKNRLAEEGIAPLDIAIVSSKNGYGISGIFKKIKHFYPDGVNALILGVTNVGKSSIVNKLIGKKRNTVSKYPGTTLKSVFTKIPFTNITLIDTPGLIPEGRFSDLVCEKCNLSIIPSVGVDKKLYKPSKDRVFLIDKLLKFKVLSDNELKPIIELYTSRNVTIHETNDEKVESILNSDILKIPCENCLENYKEEKNITKIINVYYGEDLVFKGLGWLSVKRGPLKVEVTYPETADILVRKSIYRD